MKRREDLTKDIVSRRDFLKISGLSAGALALGSLNNIPLSLAKDVYPADKITFVIPHKPGGGHDIYARAISPYLTRYLKEVSPGAKGGDIMVRNEAAAAGRKGYSMICNGKPDGYTIGAIDTSPITDSIVEKSEFDFIKLTFLVLAVSTTKVILTSRKGFNSWSEVVNAMKKEPVKIAVGSFGRTNHVATIIMNERVGTKFKPIALPGTVESMNAVMRGDVPVALASEDSVKGLIEAKEVKVLLMFTEVSEYPGAVTIKELGFPELAENISSHRFIVAPPGLEAEPKNILMAAIKKATTDKEFVAWAKKADFPLRNIYGSDAEKMFLEFMKFYQELTPILKKNLS